MAPLKDPENAYHEFVKGIWKENPVFVQVLGMCPMLAVTNTAVNALAMGAATFFVLVGSSFLVAILRNLIPKQVRISCYIIIIATFVTVADLTLMAFTPGVHKELGAFIALIVVNCMILGRQEAFASKHTVRLAVADAVGMSTVPEVVVAMQAGLKVLGISVITDECLPEALEPVDIEKILKVAEEAQPALTRLMERTIEAL